MKKIVFVSQSLRKGGAERVVSLLSQEFEKRGYEVKIVLFEDSIEYKYGGKVIFLHTTASQSYLVKLFRLFQRVAKLKKIFIKEKPDYIFSFMESCNFASILTGEKVVVSIRNNPEKKHIWYQKFLIRYLYRLRNVKKVITVSKDIEKILRDKYKLDNVKTIYNPVVIQESSISENLERYKPFILAVGRLHPQKNFEMLINAYSRTKTKEFAKLIILGEGKEKEKLLAYIKNLGLDDKVILLGNKDNVYDYYKQCEIFVLSSKYEGFPNVLIEALANGCACISTDCPTGPSEIIKHGENGLLVENENEEEMVKAIDNLFFNEILKRKFRKNAKKSVSHLELSKIANEWLKIL